MFYRIIAYLIFSRNSGYIFELEALNKKFKYYNLLKFFLDDIITNIIVGAYT